MVAGALTGGRAALAAAAGLDPDRLVLAADPELRLDQWSLQGPDPT
jgi:hypothetical protein